MNPMGVKRAIAYAALLGFPLAFLGLFFYYPLASVLREGLPRVDEVLSSPYFRRIIWFTIEQALLSTLASVALGFPLAYLLTRYDFPGKRVVKSLTIVPFVLPAITVALGFILLFGRGGWLNQALMVLFGLEEPPIKLLYTLWAIVLAHAFYNAPLIARVVNVAWEGLDPSYEESARALGASPSRVFRTVTLPQLLPSLLSAMTIVFIFCFLSFPIVLTLGGARYSTLEVEIYTQVKALFNVPQGAALAIVGLTFSLLFVYAYLSFGGIFARELTVQRKARARPLFPSWREALRPQRSLIWAFIALSALIFAGPMLAVFVDSLLVRTPEGVRLGLDWYRFVVQTQHEALIGDPPLRAVLNSLSFGLGAVAIALPLGLTIAFIVARLRRPARRPLDALLMAPIATSSVILGLALLRAYLQPPFKISGTALAVVVAHAAIVYPFVVRTTAPLLMSFDRSLVEAARSLGASRLKAFWDVERPWLASGMLVGGLFAFALSLGETSATLMLARPGLKTMPVAVYQFLAARQALGAASAMSVLMIFVSALAFVVLERQGERWLRGR
jgi:thiamine transport system permease protein